MEDQVPFTAEGLPKFDALFDYPSRFAALASATQALAAAGARYQAQYAAAWWSSWLKHLTKQGGEALSNPFGFLDKGLQQANGALLELHHSDGFFESQRELVAAVSRFRNRHRDVAEAWQLLNQAPTQRDLDDVAASLYDLRREVRRLRRQVEASGKADMPEHAEPGRVMRTYPPEVANG